MYLKSLSFISLYPEIFLTIAINVLIAYLVISDYFFKYKISFVKQGSFFSSLILFYMLWLLLDNTFWNTFIFKSFLINETHVNFVKVLIAVSFAGLLPFASRYLKDEKLLNYDYFLVLLLSFLGLFLLVSSYDLISMYLAIELQSLCFYVLATFKQYSNFSTEAGIKYFILGAFSSGLLLFGCSLLYGFTGITNFYGLQLFFQKISLDNQLFSVVFISLLFILVALLFKLAAAPFHMWSPDVYEGSPTIVTAFFAIIPKIVIISLLVRLFVNLLGYEIYYFNKLTFFCAILSLLIGTLGAIYQVKLKRLLAYSSISHVGFLLIALSITTLESYYSLFFYITVYMILSFSVFALLLSIRKWNNNLKLKKINEVFILNKTNKTLTFIFVLILFSLAGIPPLLGFYSKFYVFMTGLQAGYTIIIILASLISVIGALYYIRLIKIMLFKPSSTIAFLKPINFSMSLFISLTFLFNFYFLLLPDIVVTLLHRIMITLFI